MTPASSATDGSTLRGTPMSTMCSGRELARAARASATSELSEHCLVRSGTDDDHVGSGDGLGEAIEPDGHTLDPLGKCRAAIGRAVGDQNLGATSASKRHSDTFTHRSCADNEHPPSRELANHVGDHLDRCVADRRGSAGDARFAASPFAGGQRASEQLVERRS